MQRITINLNLISDVQDFIQIVNKIDCDVDLIKDRYVIDAKSIIGIFTLDLSKPVDLVIHSEDSTIADRFTRWRV